MNYVELYSSKACNWPTKSLMFQLSILGNTNQNRNNMLHETPFPIHMLTQTSDQAHERV